MRQGPGLRLPALAYLREGKGKGTLGHRSWTSPHLTHKTSALRLLHFHDHPKAPAFDGAVSVALHEKFRGKRVIEDSFLFSSFTQFEDLRYV